MIHDLYNWVISWAGHPNAVMALFWLAFAESSFFPIPPDVLLIAMCVADPNQALFYAMVCSLGSVLGGVAGFGIGRGAGRPLLKRMISTEKLATAESLYNRYDVWAIGIAGFTPIPYKVFTISAGAFAIRFIPFVVASAVSRSARFFIVATAFYLWGAHIKNWIDEYFNLASILFVVLLVGGFLLLRFLGRRLAHS